MLKVCHTQHTCASPIYSVEASVISNHHKWISWESVNLSRKIVPAGLASMFLEVAIDFCDFFVCHKSIHWAQIWWFPFENVTLTIKKRKQHSLWV